MSSFDLLQAVQPEEGWFAIVGISGDGTQSTSQKLVQTREEAAEVIARFVAQKRNVFFGVAKYKSGENRRKDNVAALKSFWVDVDCGPDKGTPDPKTGVPQGYLTQDAALEALEEFCELVGLPVPVIVNSGRGIHAYWILEEAIGPTLWETIADKLAEICRVQQFYVDRAVFETARILRVPNSLNYKGETPLPVTVLKEEVNPITAQELADLLGIDLDVAVEVKQKKIKKQEAKEDKHARRRVESPLFKKQQESIAHSFKGLMQRSLKDAGCRQIKEAFLNRESLTYNQWWHALSIATQCEDRDTAIHTLSKGYKDYNPVETEKIAASTKEPHRCATFEADNPGGCKGCPYKNKVGSPIALAKRVIAADPDQHKILRCDEPDDEPEEVKKDSVDIPVDWVAKNFIPKMPTGYVRGAGGGIYMETEDGDVVEVYAHDLYIVKRMFDPVDKEVVVMRLHLPKDGVRTFILPNSSLANIDKLRTSLAEQGVVCGMKKEFERLFRYLSASLSALQWQQEAEKMRLQFGWMDSDTKFVLGDKEYTKDGVFHSPPSSSTEARAAFIHEKGSLDKWKEVAKLYGRSGMEAAAFGMLTAFGSPLFKFTGHSGALINLIHPRSGTGKTTILHMANSVYGAPKDLCSSKDDTLNATIFKFGVNNHLHNALDEITNMSAEEFSSLAYAASQGVGKDRMTNGANKLRDNNTRWQSITLCSSNASFYEKLSTAKSDPDGEKMRIIEAKIEMNTAIDRDLGKEMFDHQLMENYGLAGPVYIQYLVDNVESIKEELKRTQAYIDKHLELTPRERFWSDVFACNLVGGLIAKKLELIDWDFAPIMKWLKSQVSELRDEVTPPIMSCAGTVGDYINRHIQNLLIVDGTVNARHNMSNPPLREPKGPLFLRYEPDTFKLFVATGEFKRFCSSRQINYKDTLAELKRQGVLLARDFSKHMGKGMDGPSVLSKCLVLDMKSSYFDGVRPDPETLADEKVADAGGGN